ncbi:MAG: winged helix-turn-helix transcriptional regulator, partial [Treponema sp.]|nr:winged helix-turn-helix transcriptional regulator [Treponema sp.]
MLSYNLSESNGPLYKSLYQFIREDIQSGKLKSNEKLPSKRTLARNLGISTISIENAYDQLICEGYIYSLPKRGYFV